MSFNYTKLFASITESTVWTEPLATRVVWITMLAMSDRLGRVWASVPGLARRANVTLEECEAALKTFHAPDPYSRTTENEGRRIEDIDGGWRLLNHEKYREIKDEESERERNAERQRRFRERHGGPRGTVTGSNGSNGTSQNVTANNPIADTDTDTDAEVDTEKKKKARKRATPIPENFGISERVAAWAASKGYGRLEDRLEHFLGYAKRSGKTYVDWDEALMSAIREDWAKLNGRGPGAPPAIGRTLGDQDVH